MLRLIVSMAAVLALPAAAQRIITTVAGSSQQAFRGNDGPALEASLGAVVGVAVDRQGVVYVADADNFLVAGISSEGRLEVVAGNGVRGYSGDGGPAVNASLESPRGLAVGPDGSLYVGVRGRVRRVTADGVIDTFAGSDFTTHSLGGEGGDPRDDLGDGAPATQATLSGSVAGLAFDAAGNLYIADDLNHRIRRVSPDGIITTVAGDGEAASSGDGGLATQASLRAPQGVAIDAQGRLYIAGSRNGLIRRVGVDGIIQTIAGGGTTRNDGPGVGVRLIGPDGVAADGAGNVYISEFDRVRILTPDGNLRDYAGTGQEGFEGDGGPAADARLALPEGIALDAAGNLFIADTDNRRVRRVAAGGGVITSIAGNGVGTFSGDGGPATAASLNRPGRVAVDSDDNLIIVDTENLRIRRVERGGVIRTLVGNGIRSFTGDGGPAISASIDQPGGLTFDPTGALLFSDDFNRRVRRVGLGGIIGTFAGGGRGLDGNPATEVFLTAPSSVAADPFGNVFIADSARIRRVGADGIIGPYAGTGQFEFSGDGGPAVDAGLGRTSDVVTDFAGNLFLSDSTNHRVRRIGLDGTIQTIAGNGDGAFNGDFAGDGGPAVAASLGRPLGLAIDEAGNLLIADTGNRRIRQIRPDGVIETIAGRGSVGFAGDGGSALDAGLDAAGVAVDSAGNVFIADQFNHRVRVVLVDRPVFDGPAVENLPVLLGQSGGAPVEAEPVLISASVAGLDLLGAVTLPQAEFTAAVTVGGDWLTVSPAEGATPRLLRIRADPLELEPGDYPGVITVTMPSAEPRERVLAIGFSVGPAVPPRLGIDAEQFSFTLSQGSAASSESFLVLNQGGGALPFTLAAETDSGGSWLSVSPGSGTATPGQAVAIEAMADPSGLSPGTYTGRIRVEAEAEGSPAVIPVTMTVSAASQAILLTQRGLSFTAVERGGIVPPQTVGVVNLGRGAMSWSVSRCTLTAFSCDWIEVTPDSGASDPAGEVPQLTVTVDQARLAPGEYYGLVEVRSAGAANSPQVVTVFLEVLPAGSDPGAVMTSNELVFTHVAGASSPSSQQVFAYNVSATPKSYRSSRTLERGRLDILPEDGALDPQEPTTVVVQPFLSRALGPGESSGSVTLQFSDGRVQEIKIRLVVTEAAAELKGSRKARGACTATKLLPSLKTLPDNFSVSGGWPVGLQVDVRDDCGRPQEGGSVLVEFSNGDPEIAMTSLRNGRWDGTWQTNARTRSDVTVLVEASSGGLRGSSEVRGGLREIREAPIVPDAGIVGAASPVSYEPLAPGSLVSLFGLGLSDGLAAADALPLPEALQSTSLFIAGAPMPLLFTSDGQVNAMVPYTVSANTNHQIVVQRGPTLSKPVSVNVAEAQPAVFLTVPGGAQGHVYKVVDGAQILADASNPAMAGDVLALYCSGLGAVDPAVAAGAAAGANPLSRTTSPLTLSIGGQQAQVLFSGLAPGFSGLYQVNAFMPEGVSAGDRVEVTLSIAGQTSAAVTIAAQ